MPESMYVAWWNVENLFDEEDAFTLGRRTDKLQRTIGEDVKGWTPALRDTKIGQLASVIAQMNNGAGPDLLGMCEIENRFVIDRLVDAINNVLPTPRNYRVVHADTSDARGIDVAFIYDGKKLKVPTPLSKSVFFHVVMRRNATREIVQVNFETKTDPARTLVVFGNHWPSRSGGEAESAGYRAIAGETLSFFHERVLEVCGPDTAVLAMGDFNDEPFDASLVTHALSTRQRAMVVNAKNPLLWNLMYPTLGDPDGTFYFDNQPNVLDQFLVNRNMAKQDSPVKVDPEAVAIVRFPGMASTGRYPSPLPFGGMGKKVTKEGFSDHFPIAVSVTID